MQLYNTLTRHIEEFQPLDPTNVGMYTCGPTVYKEVHIGNFRTYITSDLLRRVLMLNHFPVTSVMNITDVGHMRTGRDANRKIDPIIEEAVAAGKKPLEIAKKYTDLFLEDAKKLDILPVSHLTPATDYIPEMIAIIQTLVDKGFAYITDGNVYFAVSKFKEYGKLSGNTLDKMDQLLEAVRVSVETDKKDSADFALWKRAESDRLMKWDSPWGEGFPGWHIECSAMSSKFLGSHFDIHAGGEDLIFPHHEDEIAQSEAAFGEKFVNYWVHTNYLLIEGEKMSRSKGNIYTLSELEQKNYLPLAFRYLTYQTHYRSRMNFTWKSMTAAQIALEKLYEAAESFPEKVGDGCIEYERDFIDAVNTDLNLPKALSILWEMMRSKHDDRDKAATLYLMDDVLGLRIRETAEAMKQIPQEVLDLVAEREDMRKKKQYSQSDKLRAEIESRGYIVKDREDGRTQILKKA